MWHCRVSGHSVTNQTKADVWYSTSLRRRSLFLPWDEGSELSNRRGLYRLLPSRIPSLHPYSYPMSYGEVYPSVNNNTLPTACHTMPTQAIFSDGTSLPGWRRRQLPVCRRTFLWLKENFTNEYQGLITSTHDMIPEPTFVLVKAVHGTTPNSDGRSLHDHCPAVQAGVWLTICVEIQEIS